MNDWMSFFLFTIQKLVEMVFRLSTGLGFSLGDIDVALLLIGIFASALVIKVTHYNYGNVINTPKHKK